MYHFGRGACRGRKLGECATIADALRRARAQVTRDISSLGCAQHTSWHVAHCSTVEMVQHTTCLMECRWVVWWIARFVKLVEKGRMFGRRRKRKDHDAIAKSQIGASGCAPMIAHRLVRRERCYPAACEEGRKEKCRTRLQREVVRHCSSCRCERCIIVRERTDDRDS